MDLSTWPPRSLNETHRVVPHFNRKRRQKRSVIRCHAIVYAISTAVIGGCCRRWHCCKCGKSLIRLQPPGYKQHRDDRRPHFSVMQPVRGAVPPTGCTCNQFNRVPADSWGILPRQSSRARFGGSNHCCNVFECPQADIRINLAVSNQVPSTVSNNAVRIMHTSASTFS